MLEVDGLPAKRDAAVKPLRAEDGQQHILLPLPAQPAQAEQFAIAQVERDTAHRGRTQIVHTQADRPACRAGLGLLHDVLDGGGGVGHIGAGHERHDHALAGIGCGQFAHRLPIAQHDDTVGDAEDFVHAVRHEDDRPALRFPPVHQVKEAADLLAVQAGRRLVEDDRQRFLAQRLEDLHDLLLVGRQAGNRRIGIDRRRDRTGKEVEQLLGRAFTALPLTSVHRRSGSCASQMFSAMVMSGIRLNSW